MFDHLLNANRTFINLGMSTIPQSGVYRVPGVTCWTVFSSKFYLVSLTKF